MAGFDPPDPFRPLPARETPPLLPVGSRVAIYLLLIFGVLSLGGGLIAVLFLDPEVLKQAEAAASATEARAIASEAIDFGWLLIFQIALAPAVVVLTLGFVHFVDRKPVTELGARLPFGPSSLFRQTLGATCGALALFAVWWILATPFLEFNVQPFAVGADGQAGSTQLVLYALGFLLLAGLEEWIFRGYVYAALRERFPWIHAAGFSALLFTLLHISNPGMRGAGLLNTCLLGLCLAAMRELTHSLWAPTVFHGAWNFAVGCIASLPVSGFELPRLFEVEVEGPKVWSGGAYGPEGSWLLTVALFLLTMVLAQALHLRGELAAAEDDDISPS